MIYVKILIICGHGDGDPGACALGYKEATLVRECGQLLQKTLSPYAEVTLFDTSKNMYKHLKAGNSFNFRNYDYVIELHLNACVNDTKGNGKTTGVEALVHKNEKGTSVEQAILKNIVALGFRNRGVKVRSDLLNMNICKGRQNVSYALLEMCFIDDADDMKLFVSKKTNVVNAIADGIISGFGLKKTEITNPKEIAVELNKTYFPITEMSNFVKALEEAKKANSPLYWGYYKLVNKIK